jgi:chromatin remodeling complex protein RSC6
MGFYIVSKHKRFIMAPKKTMKSTPAPVAEETPVVDTVVSVDESVVESVVAVETVTETPVVEVEVVGEVDKYTAIVELLLKFSSEMKEAAALVKTLQKEHNKAQKASSKKTKRVSTSNPLKPRTPSGFAKPTKLSDDLCSFLGIPSGSQMARTEVTRVLNEYIKKNSLQDVTDKRTIVPDEKLQSILQLKEGDKLTYFNLQTYIKHHFQKD